MVRIIPRRTKVKLEFIRGFTAIDLILAVIAAVVLIVLIISNFEGHIWVAIVWAIFGVSLFFKISDSDRLYITYVHIIRYTMQKKTYQKYPKNNKPNVKAIFPFEGIYQDRFLSV